MSDMLSLTTMLSANPTQTAARTVTQTQTVAQAVTQLTHG